MLHDFDNEVHGEVGWGGPSTDPTDALPVNFIQNQHVQFADSAHHVLPTPLYE